MTASEFEFTLEVKRPDIACEWHPTKNGNLTTYDVDIDSDKKVWWMCKKGHAWRASVVDRTRVNTPCPYCTNQKVLKGFNDLATVYRDVAKEWHPTKNGDLTPRKVVSDSDKKVWWMCDNGHEWQASIVSRTLRHAQCPCCADHEGLDNFNSLAKTDPDIAEEWHPTKNGDLTPYDVVAGAHTNVWWMCDKGHEWQASVAARTHMNEGCPYCSNKLVLMGFNDLGTLYPDIADEWNRFRNGDLTPYDVVADSDKRVWWMCENSHEWVDTIEHRTHLRTPCPYCSHERSLLESDFA